MCDTTFALGCSRQFPGEKLLNQLYNLCDGYLVVMPCLLTLNWIGQRNHWQRLQPSHKRLFMDILSSMADFAASYNSDLNLRSRMQHVCGDRYAHVLKVLRCLFSQDGRTDKISLSATDPLPIYCAWRPKAHRSTLQCSTKQPLRLVMKLRAQGNQI